MGIDVCAESESIRMLNITSTLKVPISETIQLVNKYSGTRNFQDVQQTLFNDAHKSEAIGKNLYLMPFGKWCVKGGKPI